MWRFSLHLFLVPIVCLSGFVQAQENGTECPERYHFHDGLCFRHLCKPRTYLEAKTRCEQDGGRIAVVEDEEGNLFLAKFAQRFRAISMWLGIIKKKPSKEWTTDIDFKLLIFLRFWRPLHEDTCDANDSPAPKRDKRAAKEFIAVVMYALTTMRFAYWEETDIEEKHTTICQVPPGVGLNGGKKKIKLIINVNDEGMTPGEQKLNIKFSKEQLQKLVDQTKADQQQG